MLTSDGDGDGDSTAETEDAICALLASGSDKDSLVETGEDGVVVEVEADAEALGSAEVEFVGALSARILANELEDMSYFTNEKKLFSYTGLTPSEHSSGEHKRLGHISRQGKAILRKILVQVAWRTIKGDAHLAEVFERISKKAGKKRAIVAIARKMIGCIRSCFINGEMWPR